MRSFSQMPKKCLVKKRLLTPTPRPALLSLAHRAPVFRSPSSSPKTCAPRRQIWSPSTGVDHALSKPIMMVPCPCQGLVQTWMCDSMEVEELWQGKSAGRHWMDKKRHTERASLSSLTGCHLVSISFLELWQPFCDHEGEKKKSTCSGQWSGEMRRTWVLLI